MLRKSTLSIFVIIVGMILPATLFTQDEGSSKQLYNSIEKLLSEKEYDKAIPLLEELVKTNPTNANFNFKMAYAIIRGNTELDPLPYLEVAIKNYTVDYKSRYTQDAAPVDALWFYALQTFYRYEYTIAKDYFQKYIQFIPTTNLNYAPCLDYIGWCNTGPEYLKNPIKVRHISFHEAKSLPKHFHSALFSPDESIFIFTADQNPEVQNYKTEHVAFNDDIYTIFLKDGVWSKPTSISSNINTLKREACIGMNPNGRQLLIYREDVDGGNIYYSDMLDSNVWSMPKKFPEPINSNFNESHATISADGRTIFFTSDRPGGFGGLDIYMSKLGLDGTWGKAINLGSEVNSSEFEESPHVQANSNLLYFSSNRPGGMGEFDVYRCELKQDSIAYNVQNIGYPINTPRNDLFFKTSIDGGKAYYSSPCKSTNGEYDFMTVEFLDKQLYPNIKVKGVVVNQDNDTLKNIPITLFNLTVRDITDSSMLDRKTGYYLFNLHSKNNYFASVEYDGEVYFSKPFKFNKYYADYSFSNVIEIDPIVIGDSTMRQDIGEFKVFRNNFAKPENDPVFDTVKNMFAVLEKMPLQSVSRMNTSISIKPPTTPIAVKEPEPIPEPEKVLTQPEPEKVVEINQISEVKDIIEISDENTKVHFFSSKNKGKGITADSLLSNGISVYQDGKYDESLENMTKALSMLDSTKDFKKQVICLEYIADAQYNSGNLNEALESHKSSLDIIEKNFGTEELKAKQQEIAGIYSDLMYKDEALNYLEKSLQVDKNLNNPAGISDTYQKMADVYMKHNDQEKAIEYLEKGLEGNKDLQKKAEAYNKLGISYQQLQQLLIAIDYYNKAIQTGKKINDNKGVAKYQNNIGNAYFDLKKFDESMIHYKISLSLQQQLLDERGASIALYNIGNVMRVQEKYNLAIDNYTQSISLASKIHDQEILAKNYFAMVLIYKILKNFPLALEYYKKYIGMASPFAQSDYVIYLDKVKYPVNSEEISLLQAKMQRTEEFLKFEKQKYDQELLLLQQKDNLLRITRIALVILSIGVCIMLILLLIRFRTRRKYYRQLSLQNTEILQKQEEITVQRENLEELNVLLEKLSIVASKTGNAVAILKPDSSFEWVNTSFESLYNSHKSSFLEFAYNDLEKQHVIECLEQKQSVQYETKRILQSQNEIWVQCMLTPIVFGDEIYKIIVLESDIDAQKQAAEKIRLQRDEIQEQAKVVEQQRDVAVNQKNEIEIQKNAIEKTIDELQLTQKKLVESEKMASLGNLVAGVSHEINTPVGIGIAATTSLQSKTADILELFTSRKMKQSDLDSYLQTTKSATQLIQSNLKRTGELVKSFKRVSVDEMTDSLRTFNMFEYITEVFTNLDAKLKDKNVTLKIDCPHDIEIYSYPGAFAQIMSNMTSNALLHAFKDKNDGEITVTARIIGEKLYLMFADNGCGMSPEVVQKVFNPFFTTNMQAGTGLGMNIVYNLVTQKLQGDIFCESEIDKGAVFKIDVPLIESNE